MSRNFHSMFADDIRGMVEHKKALGHKAESYEWNMQNFDRYCMKFFPEEDILTEEIVLGWCEAGKEFRKSAYRANAIREFGRYLSAIGKSAYVLPREFFPPKRAELPHLFTDEELVRFFDAADHFPHYARSPLAEYIVPVVFRLQYACGLRPQEVRLLRRADFDFRRNTIYISESKWCRDRCLSINPELMQLCRRYDVIAQGLVPDRAYFFPFAIRERIQPWMADRRFPQMLGHVGEYHSHRDLYALYVPAQFRDPDTDAVGRGREGFWSIPAISECIYGACQFSQQLLLCPSSAGKTGKRRLHGYTWDHSRGAI